MSEGYSQAKIDGKETYIQTNSVNKLREVDAVIFDCDGVLIDIRESYNRTISETVSYIIKELIGFQLPKNLISRETIHLFKESGGFNNDWDLTYALLMFIFCNLPESFHKVLKKYVSSNRYRDNLLRRFLYVKDGIREEYTANRLNNVVIQLGEELIEFARMSDTSGIASIEERLAGLKSIRRDCYKHCATVKHLLSYPGDVKDSVLTRVFEEIFCGPKLFQNVYKCVPRFYQEKGLIENERVILLPETLDQLTSIIGKPNLGISSGRTFKLAKYKLNELLEKFSTKGLIFLDDIEAAERENASHKGLKVNLKKPNPFSLLASSRGLKPFRFALYVGDSMEDVVMVKEANRLDSRFLFAGVYYYSDCKEDVLRSFIKTESEIILPSVNELPVILETLKKGEQYEGIKGFQKDQ